MLLHQMKAPTLEALRPFKRQGALGFPVYADLVQELLAAQEISAPSWRIAHVLGTCAGYAYSQRPTVAMIMARMGLEENYTVQIGEYVDAMFICSTAFLVQSRCGRVLILCYRGTEPTNLINWLTDADVDPERVRFALGGGSAYDIHAGFYRNVRATRYEVMNAIQNALDGRPLVEGAPQPEHRLEALYVTGHSLGAAMAALLGVMISTESAYARVASVLKAVYTFGQPMIGPPEFAVACDTTPALRQRLVRFVYGHDLVPSLPPRMSGPFAHFGREVRYVPALPGPGTWGPSPDYTQQVSGLLDISLAGWAFVARQVRRLRNVTFPHSMVDHGPARYVAALTAQNGVPTEFGDTLPAPAAAAPALGVAPPPAARLVRAQDRPVAAAE